MSDTTKKFFEKYEKGINTGNIETMSSCYADFFLFGNPQGTQPVRKEDFLNMLPKRQEFFKTVGLQKTKLLSLEETRLDESYIMVKVYWNMRFKKETDTSIESENAATYILNQREESLRIVFQIDHQDLMEKVRNLGLLPAKE